MAASGRYPESLGIRNAAVCRAILVQLPRLEPPGEERKAMKTPTNLRELKKALPGWKISRYQVNYVTGEPVVDHFVLRMIYQHADVTFPCVEIDQAGWSVNRRTICAAAYAVAKPFERARKGRG
jgi:hypothetical protein